MTVVGQRPAIGRIWRSALPGLAGPTHWLVWLLLELGSLSLDFGRVNRITFHHDGITPESETDHTVMLGLIACAFTEQVPLDLDRGLIVQYAFMHDLVEVYAGDTNTHRRAGRPLRCDGYVAGGLIPSAWREHPQVLRSYATAGELLDAVVTQPEEDRMAIAEKLLSDDNVAFVYSRMISVGCFSFEIRRA